MIIFNRGGQGMVSNITKFKFKDEIVAFVHFSVMPMELNKLGILDDILEVYKKKTQSNPIKDIVSSLREIRYLSSHPTKKSEEILGWVYPVELDSSVVCNGVTVVADLEEIKYYESVSKTNIEVDLTQL